MYAKCKVTFFIAHGSTLINFGLLTKDGLLYVVLILDYRLTRLHYFIRIQNFSSV